MSISWNIAVTTGRSNTWKCARVPKVESTSLVRVTLGGWRRYRLITGIEFPEINFVYPVRHTCWNLSSGDRCEEFECHHIEADTIIFFIYSHIRKSGILDPVVIDAKDTDGVVLSAFVLVARLLFFWQIKYDDDDNTEGLLAIKQKKGRDLCPKDVADIIVPLHIFSGCDTTSGFYGHGK